MKMNTALPILEAYLKDKQYSKSSITGRKRMLGYFLSWLAQQGQDPLQLTTGDVLAFIRCYQQKGLSQRSIERYINSVKLYYDALQEAGHLARHPLKRLSLKGIQRKTLHRVLEPQELHALYHSYPCESIKDERDKALLGLLVYQGLSTDELAKLTVSDIQLREGLVNVPGGPRSNGRSLTLEAAQVYDLHTYVVSTRAKLIAHSTQRTAKYGDSATTTGSTERTDKLFVNYLGGEGLSNAMYRLLQRLTALNKKVYNAKQLRASVIVKWLRMYNLREVQYRAGHRYVSSTEAFLQNEMEGLKESVNKYHPLD